MTQNVLREDATLGTPAHDDPDMPPRVWTEDAMLRVLWRHFAGQSWAPIPQVTVNMLDLDDPQANLSTWTKRQEARRESFAREVRDVATVLNNTADRRIDLLAVRRPRKEGIGPFESLAIEVKVTRADFLSDVKNPAKQAAWKAAATRHCYAVPAGLVKPDEVPEGCGLLYVKSHGSTDWGWAEWVTRAPYRPGHAPDLPARVWVALMHRTAALEGATRGWQTSPEAAGNPQELRAALQAAHRETEKATKRAQRAEEKASSWQTAYGMAAGDGIPCRWCAKPVKPLRPRDRWFASWRHIDKADDAPCELIEAAQYEDGARRDWDAADEAERQRKTRHAHAVHRDRFNAAVEAEPWRAFIPTYGLLGASPAGEAPNREDER